jgi:LCP family protein required for cell wall assembly
MATTRTHDPLGHGRLMRVLVGLTASISLLISLVAGASFAAYHQADTSHPTFALSPQPSDGTQQDLGPCVKDVCNYLLLGSDSRAGLSHAQQVANGTNADIGGSNRSDVIMVVHTDPKAEKATILSFPRDLWVPIPGHGVNKINSAFEGGLNGGGPQLVARTVEDLTGLHINHILYVDLAGFEGVVNSLGGVDMCIPSYLADPATGRVQDPLTQLDVKPGCQRLDGQQALAYVRTRHLPCDFIPDFSRIGRQQQFLRAVLNRMLQPSEIAKAPTLIKPVVKNLVTDPGFKLADIIYLVSQLQGISTGAADFRAVPATPAVVVPAGYITPLDIVKMDPSAKDLFRSLRDGTPLPKVGTSLASTPTSPANIVTAVVDHSSGGLTDAVEKTLSDSGFDISPGVVAYPAAGFSETGSMILYRPGSSEQAGVVQKYFPNLKLVEAKKGELTSAAVAVVVTASYRPVPVGSGGGTASSCPGSTGG